MARQVVMLPEGSVQQLITYLRGQLDDKWTAVEAAYSLLGYTINSARGMSTRSSMAGIPTALDACFELESLLRDYARMKTHTLSKKEEGHGEPSRMIGQLNVPPWLTAFLLQQLQKLLTT